ncbi:Detected protein of unknown function [Hibiscus syriacus]|uniref:Uncharacterized protein n=1 Tax=Hibiscus syriacus TaxID=106335 RepID=A0A6A2XY72_HIBSY|nr:uncharacterized protein LOC120184649 [Hibiscus syriacus]KAE8663669.1 Detected protein of unknown function [Hibiscus syriacus]
MDPNKLPSTSPVLLYGFILLVLDLPETSSSDSQLAIIPVFNRITAFSSQVVEKQSIKGKIGMARGTCRRMVSGGGGEESVEMEGSSIKEPNEISLHHPCHYLGLAKLAFLKCLGLDLLCSDNASITEQI